MLWLLPPLQTVLKILMENLQGGYDFKLNKETDKKRKIQSEQRGLEKITTWFSFCFHQHWSPQEQ